ncbi:hypothetical protein QR680_009743 [Steinernema hermaphroditum]|uniref:Uncharacterized protein n=1 Tax=Steinernema hermaphroditum TaxID=289476 RepID=A0AA39ILH8_9BILA|nr:hypothetical protein QR680_009743 [Steinernema hermaphroditum]
MDMRVREPQARPGNALSSSAYSLSSLSSAPRLLSCIVFSAQLWESGFFRRLVSLPRTRRIIIQRLSLGDRRELLATPPALAPTLFPDPPTPRWIKIRRLRPEVESARLPSSSRTPDLPECIPSPTLNRRRRTASTRRRLP